MAAPLEYSSPQPASQAATVIADFGASGGTLRRTERCNKLTPHRYVDQCDADVAFYNEQGLHGTTCRTWMFRPPDTPA